MNENANNTQKPMEQRAKALLRGKFITVNAVLKKSNQ